VQVKQQVLREKILVKVEKKGTVVLDETKNKK
jgi:hypothetical protein